MEASDATAADLATALLAVVNLREQLGVALTLPLDDYDGPGYDDDGDGEGG